MRIRDAKFTDAPNYELCLIQKGFMVLRFSNFRALGFEVSTAYGPSVLGF